VTIVAPIPRDLPLAASQDRDLPHDPAVDALWPTAAQELLLRSALLTGPQALEAWQRWKSQHDLVESDLDRGSFRLLPLVYKNLSAQGIEEPHLPRLKGIYRYWWCSNQDLFYQAAGLLERLHEAGIRTMVLKGAAASVLYYDDTGVRPMADVDVLVPYAQVQAAIECVGRLGWRAATGYIDEEVRYRHSTPMVNDAGREFDLHWHSLREGLQADADDGFWRRSVPLGILHVRSRGLAPADALLHTVVHGMRWNEEPTIRWITDAMAILKSSSDRVDWDALIAEACARRVQLRMVYGLGYLKRTFGAPIPDDAWKRLREARVSSIERLEFRYLGLRSDRQKRDQLMHLGSMLALEYARVVSGRKLQDKLGEMRGFLRYRLRGRNERVVVAARHAARWLGLAPRRKPPGLPPGVAGPAAPSP